MITKTGLQALIDAAPKPPHGTFMVSETIDEDERTLTLIWECEIDQLFEGMYGDEPWTDWGGNAIIGAAGLPDFTMDTGTEQYQDKFGDRILQTWASWRSA